MAEDSCPDLQRLPRRSDSATAVTKKAFISMTADMKRGVTMATVWTQRNGRDTMEASLQSVDAMKACTKMTKEMERGVLTKTVSLAQRNGRDTMEASLQCAILASAGRSTRWYDPGE